ncbi:MAG: ribosomal protection-like ABC-F family protein [Oscillospiraceae bacterium]
MSYINVKDLTFAYEGSYDNIFENVSFCIDTSWRLGFIGRNGRGKTTLLNILLGKYEYSGTVTMDCEPVYFPYEVADRSQLTIEVMQSACPEAEDWELIREASLLEVDTEALYRPFDTLSGGEQNKVLLGALFAGENRFLLLDEPTNHLDSEARLTVGSYLQKKKGFILVSHDRKLLDSCVDHIISVNRADIDVEQGNFSSWQENFMRKQQHEQAENERLKKDIKRLTAAAERTAEWADISEKKKIGFDPSKTEKSISRRSYEGAKSKKAMSRAKAFEERTLKAAEEKSSLLKNTEESAPLKLSPLIYHKNLLVSAEKLSLFYGDKAVCGNISFELCRGERLAVTGRNGCGKSTLLKLICGEDIRCEGRINVGSGLKISRVEQSTDGLRGSLSGYAAEYGIDESLFKAILRKLGFERVQFEKDMGEFSGGQKKKVLIARSLCERAHLYIWDEPLNFIDIISRIQIETLLNEYNAAMIFVEHDDTFREKIADKTLLLG